MLFVANHAILETEAYGNGYVTQGDHNGLRRILYERACGLNLGQESPSDQS